MKFQFSAESILRLKDSELQQAKNRCRLLQRQIEECRQAEQQLRQDLETYTQSAHDTGQGFVDRDYISGIFISLQQLNEQAQQLQNDLATATQHSVALYQETETLLQFKQELFRTHRQTESKRELATQTDSIMHRRRRAT